MQTKLLPLLVIAASAGAVIPPTQAIAQQILPRHVPEAIARLHLQPVGGLPGTNSLALVIGLPLRNQEALTNLFQQIYDPASPNYHHYLTPQQFTERFGPTEQDYQAVVNFAKTNGLEVVTTHASRILLDVHGKASDIEAALHVKLQTYRHPTEAREFYAPDVDPVVDASLPIMEIAGISDYAVLHPMGFRQQTTGQIGTASGSAPNGSSYMGKDFRNAYAPGVSLDGTGQILGLFEADGYYTNDIANYEAKAGLPNVPLQNILVDGFSGTPSTNNYEVALDIEMAVSMAPGLAAVIVFECPNSVADWLDALDTMATNTQIRQFSSSWGYTGGSNPNTAFDQIFMKMALQGQSVFQAAGDGDAWTNPIWVPAASPYLTSVGGTTLSMNGSGASYASETVWNSGDYTNAGLSGPWFANGNGYWGSGGGSSASYSIPYWQQGVNMVTNQGSTTLRNIPDVAMPAENIWVIYNNGAAGPFVGTSCAAPLWAGFIALVNQQATNYNQPPVGFINPALYNLGAGASYASCFHDITNGDNTWPGSPTNFYAVAGYDLCTGWGSPNGSNLINALTVTSSMPILVWLGDGLANTWDTTNANWFNGTNSVAFASHDNVKFDDTGSAGPAINMAGFLAPAAVAVNATQSYTFSGSGYLVGGMALTKSGSGILTLNNTGTNTYYGGTVVNNGSLVFGTGSALPAGGTLTLNNTVAITVTTANALSDVTANGTNSITGNGNSGTGIGTLNDTGTLMLFVSGGSAVFDLTGTMTGSGTLVLGSTAMTLRFNGTAGDSGALFNLGTGSSIASVRKTSTTAISLGGLTGASGTQLRGNSSTGGRNMTYTIGGANVDTEFDGVIADGTVGTVALTKTGAGAFTLTGANTYSGGTTISNGALLVNNSGGSATGTGAVTVANGGSLGGTGMISGAVTVNSGGTLAPGNLLGALTLNNNLTLASGSTTFAQVQHAPPTNSAVNISGALTEGGTLIVTAIGGAALGAGDTFKLFGAAGYSGAFDNVVLPPLLAGLGWNLSALTTTGTLSVVTRPVIRQHSFSGTGLVFSGTGGVANANYYLLTSTNITLPLTNWTRVLTNQYDSSGNFNLTNPAQLNLQQSFYLLQSQ